MCYKTDSASKEGGGGGYIADPASNKAYLSLITGWGILEELSFSDICIVLLVLTKKTIHFGNKAKRLCSFSLTLEHYLMSPLKSHQTIHNLTLLYLL
jgi:hypothetical protein